MLNYTFINNLLGKNITKYFPKMINRKIFRRFNIFFVPTSLKNIPINYYPINTSLSDQIKLVYQFQNKKKLVHETTYKNLHILLQKLFKKKPFTFFDVGGDNIDLYLFLNFKVNIKYYYLTNFKLLISILKILKKNLNLITFFLLQKLILKFIMTLFILVHAYNILKTIKFILKKFLKKIQLIY